MSATPGRPWRAYSLTPSFEPRLQLLGTRPLVTLVRWEGEGGAGFALPARGGSVRVSRAQVDRLARRRGWTVRELQVPR